MKGFKITDIIKVVFGETLLELHFNIVHEKEKLSFMVCISDDGETILFSQKEDWIKPEEIKYEIYLAIPIDKNNDELSKLINNEIQNIQYGVEKTLYTNKSVLYYFKINTDKSEFLFFNNGDEGAYSFDKINEILSSDIYGYEWVQSLSLN